MGTPLAPPHLLETSWVAAHFGVDVQTTAAPVGLAVTDLVQLALRRNPRRAHLLVSTVLGKHLPVDPRVVAGTGRLLGTLVGRALEGTADEPIPADWAAAAQATVSGAEPDALLAVLPAPRAAPDGPVVLGFAETATALGHLVADQLAAPWYLHSTRRVVDGVEVAGTFEEGHSHATTHLLLPVPGQLLDGPGPLVLVDDEISTGRTAMATIAALHRRAPRRRYLLASLIDLRTPADVAEMDSLAIDLGVSIEVVSLARGRVDLPAGLVETVAAAMPAVAESAAGSAVAPGLRIVEVRWPPGLSDGGRHGMPDGELAPFAAAVAQATATVSRAIGRARTVLVVGTEEFMYLPLRIALDLAELAPAAVTFQSTTRSPVHPVDQPGYPIRRRFSFAATDVGETGTRFLYNATIPPGPLDHLFGSRGSPGHPSAAADLHDGPAIGDAPDRVADGSWPPDPVDHGHSTEAVTHRPAGDDPEVIVLVVDSAADVAGMTAPGGFLAVLPPSIEVVVVRVTATPLPRAGVALPEPLRGPEFGSYAADEVSWLLTDLSHLELEGDVAQRERLIQSGQAHYAESLPQEYQPDWGYQDLFDRVLADSAARLAEAVGLVTELVLAERGHDIVLASLARAGTPVGILMRRWARFRHGLTLPHYAVSIVRGRGIDPVAMRYLAAHHNPADVVFVDGWTGKGAIAKELTAALQELAAAEGLVFNDDLAVLADPGYCVRTFGTRDDFLIASACLNSTVSGLISRTVLNPAILRPDQFHGAKFYRELADGDRSAMLLDAVSAEFAGVRRAVDATLPALAGSDRTPTFAGWAAIERIRAEYGIASVNFVKPGVGETTRVLLRRVPWRILLRENNNPDHDHLRLLAADREVPIECRPDLPYSCVGLIKPVSDSDRGEG